MHYNYWTIQVRPTPMSISAIGIGVIVEDPATGDITHQFISNPRALLKPFPNSNIVVQKIRSLDHWLTERSNTPPTLELGEKLCTAAMLNRLARQWNNRISINPKDIVAADSIESAAKLLFDNLIDYGGASKSPKRADKVRNQLWATYSSKDPLRKLLVRKPEVLIDSDLESQFDLGVIRDGNILELNSAFQISHNATMSMQAWTWRVSNLRSSGAQLTLPNGTKVDVDNRAPIVAALWPSEDGKEDKKVNKQLAPIIRQWDKLGIDYIDSDEVESHVALLSNRVAS